MQELEIPLSQHHIPHSYTSPTHQNMKTLFYTRRGFRFELKTPTPHNNLAQTQHNTSLTRTQGSQRAFPSSWSSPPSFPLLLLLLLTPKLRKSEGKERDYEIERQEGEWGEWDGGSPPYLPEIQIKRGEKGERTLLCVCSWGKKRREWEGESRWRREIERNKSKIKGKWK